MKNKSKIRQNWLRQERNSKGHFMTYKKEKNVWDYLKDKSQTKTHTISLLDDLKQYQSFDLKSLEHAFYAGLKANNSFYPPSKLWEFYKRDRKL